jgi:hypothetical protein
MLKEAESVEPGLLQYIFPLYIYIYFFLFFYFYFIFKKNLFGWTFVIVYGRSCRSSCLFSIFLLVHEKFDCVVVYSF